MKNTSIEQLEFGIKSQIRNGFRNARNDRSKRATLAKAWFTRMRQVVNLALPTQPMASIPPEQTYLQIKQTTLL